MEGGLAFALFATVLKEEPWLLVLAGISLSVEPCF